MKLVDKRSEFSPKTKLAAFERAGGRCERCNNKILSGAQYNHIVDASIGGSNALDNCEVCCARCHGAHTRAWSTPQVAKTKRILKKRAGIETRKRRHPMPGSRASGLKRKMDGSVEVRGGTHRSRRG